MTTWTGQIINISSLLRKMEADEDARAFATSMAAKLREVIRSETPYDGYTDERLEQLEEIALDFEFEADDPKLTGRDLDKAQMYDFYNWCDDYGVWVETNG